MTSWREILGGMWTEVKIIVDGEVKQTTCCCDGPGLTRRGCQRLSGNKTPCRCDCHRGAVHEKPLEGHE